MYSILKALLKYILLQGLQVLFLLAAGESVEENANLVVRLLIRRPECLGPSLCGEGGQGLLAAINEALEICKDPSRDGPDKSIARHQ